MARAFIGVGSNIEPAQNVRAATHALARRLPLVGISTVYLTDALGDAAQPPYYNCVLEVNTEAPPREIKFGILRTIEDSLGRQRTTDKFAPRTIDLDLIVYGDLTLDRDGIRLPDPDILRRAFLAIPLYELAPNLVLAGYGVRISEIAARLPQHGMRPLQDYAQQLREEVVLQGGPI